MEYLKKKILKGLMTKMSSYHQVNFTLSTKWLKDYEKILMPTFLFQQYWPFNETKFFFTIFGDTYRQKKGVLCH